MERTKDKRALQHAIAWAVHHIFLTNKEAMGILENKEMPEPERIEKLRGPNGTDYRLLNLILLLKPMIEIAKEEYTDQGNFFEWFEDKWKYIEENKMVKDVCKCKGCRVEEKEEVKSGK